MANICSFSMCVKGKHGNIESFYNALIQEGNVYMGRGADAEINYDDEEGKVMVHFMGYDKDNDVYDELNKGDKQQIESLAKRVAEKHKVTELRSSCGDPYDWFELWDDEDEDYIKYL